MRIPVRCLYSTLLIAIFCNMLAGCRNREAAVIVSSPAQTQEKIARYPLHGLVLGIGAQTGELTIKHDEIHGFMPGMTMNFKVKDSAVLQKIAAGDEIDAVLLVPANDDNYLLDQIRVLRHTASGVALPPHTLLAGEQVPNMALVNQDGHAIHLKDYRGKPLLVTFIYTRCPMPKACPMITSHFARVHALLTEDAKASATHLLSITLDPDYDTPKVLREYGLAYLQDRAEGFQHWEFARSTPADLKSLAEAFGLEYHEESRQIVHTVRTILIGPDGKMLQSWDGSSWSPLKMAHAVAQAIPGAVR